MASIILRKMGWSNMFSYGEDNVISLSEAPVTQLMGLNGHGKSSIPLILEEILYNKNSKGVKKAKIKNRYTTGTPSGWVTFDKDQDQYKVSLERKSSVKVTLTKNGEDISSHTAPKTFEQIKEILGADFSTMSQLVYQSSKSSLQFLSATDTQRKKFLTLLFDQKVYAQLHDVFKAAVTEAQKEVSKVQGSMSTVQKWLEAHSTETTEFMELTEVPSDAELAELTDSMNDYKVKLKSIDADNATINKNNRYLGMKEEAELALSKIELLAEDKQDTSQLSKEVSELKKKRVEVNTKIGIELKYLKGLDSIGDGECPKCLQHIDTNKIESMRGVALKKIEDLDIELDSLDTLCVELASSLADLNKSNKALEEYNSKLSELEKLMNFIDNDLPIAISKKGFIVAQIEEVKQSIDIIQNSIAQAAEHNRKAEIHNTKVVVIAEQLEEYKEQFQESKAQLSLIQVRLADLDILKKTFSSTGLVSYKLESMAKTLEQEINNYLSKTSQGRFLLQFVLAGDKLNIEIVDEGSIVDIEELSSGELARVNLATLLAIRSLMSNIAASKINILFLDEVTGVLDDEGKETMVDILMREEGLNTFFVAHDYNHPLIPKLQVIKEDKISRVEHG